MTLESYATVSARCQREAEAEWESKIIRNSAIAAVILGAGFWWVSGRSGIGALGAVLGLLMGYQSSILSRDRDAAATADSGFIASWCALHGMEYLGRDYKATDSPRPRRGLPTNIYFALSGRLNGRDTVIFNSNLPGQVENSAFGIIRITAPKLPLGSLSIGARGAVIQSDLIDNVERQFSTERPVSLESAAFNRRFDLTVHKTADEIVVRQIFDPATIHALVELDGTTPKLLFKDQIWWVISSKAFEARDLERVTETHTQALKMIALITRSAAEPATPTPPAQSV